MKKYLSFLTFAFMAVISLTLASCGGDDDEDVAESTIVGTWEVTDIDFPYDNGEL